MLGPSVQMMNEYRTFLVKMLHDTQLKNAKAYVKNATTCLQCLTDIQVVLSLATMMAMLKFSQTLIKFAQKNDAFVCDFLGGVQVTYLACSMSILVYI
jgi:hypothetical protein